MGGPVIGHWCRGAISGSSKLCFAIVQLSVSLGGGSLVCCSRDMIHASLIGTPPENPADLVRRSAGIEESEDLIADLERGLATATKASGADGIEHHSPAIA